MTLFLPHLYGSIRGIVFAKQAINPLHPFCHNIRLAWACLAIYAYGFSIIAEKLR
jgi:hypothetical protein